MGAPHDAIRPDIRRTYRVRFWKLDRKGAVLQRVLHAALRATNPPATLFGTTETKNKYRDTNSPVRPIANPNQPGANMHAASSTSRTTSHPRNSPVNSRADARSSNSSDTLSATTRAI